MELKFNIIIKNSEFKYLEENNSRECLEISAIEESIHKMERAYRITKDIYNKKSIFKNTKISHCSTVVRLECLYGSEHLVLNYNLDKLEIL